MRATRRPSSLRASEPARRPGGRAACEWIIKTVVVCLMVILTWITVLNSRANTCAKTRLLGRVVFIGRKTNPGSAWPGRQAVWKPRCQAGTR